MVKNVNDEKVFLVYVEIVARGSDKESVFDVVKDELDITFGEDNSTMYNIQEMTEDEIIELESGVNSNIKEEVVGVEVDVESELDEMDIKRDDIISDELGN